MRRGWVRERLTRPLQGSLRRPVFATKATAPQNKMRWWQVRPLRRCDEDDALFPSVLSHFQRREMPVEGRNVERQHHQLGVESNVFINGLVAVLTERDAEVRVLNRLDRRMEDVGLLSYWYRWGRIVVHFGDQTHAYQNNATCDDSSNNRYSSSFPCGVEDPSPGRPEVLRRFLEPARPLYPSSSCCTRRRWGACVNCICNSLICARSIWVS